MPSTRIRLADLRLLAVVVRAVGVVLVLTLMRGGDEQATAEGGATASPGTTARVSVDSAGNQANSGSSWASISADGRYVAFQSGASNLVPGGTNGQGGIFVHDRKTGETTRVSVDSTGVAGNAKSDEPVISADGRYVAFFSQASNLVPADTNGERDVFVHDRRTGATTRVNVASDGNQADGPTRFGLDINADGRYIAFSSRASNLVPNDTNTCILYPHDPGPCPDVFVHDRKTGETTRVSVDGTDNQGNDASYSPSMSADGRYVAFISAASNLVPGDTNRGLDVFVQDRQTGQTTRVNVDSAGTQADGDALWGAGKTIISADGRYVAFVSQASNLVAGDTNGWRDVFVHDRKAGRTARVSVSSAGTEGDSASGGPVISSDGRYVAFDSSATNLAPTDANGHAPDVFIHDLRSGETTLVSVDSAGVQGNDSSASPAMSSDGRYVAFVSYASNFVPGDTNVCGPPHNTHNCPDVFVHDRLGRPKVRATPAVVAPSPTVFAPAPAPTVPSSPTPVAAVIEAPPLGSGGGSGNSSESYGIALIAAAGGGLLAAAGGWYARRRRRAAGGPTLR